MTTITDIKGRVQGLSPARFQEFCDTLIHKNGYGRVHGYGMQAGTGKTTIGNPDSYFRKDNGKYVFVAYTTQQNNIYIKLKEDIEKCLDKSKTGLSTTEIDEIICCHTSSNLSAGDDKKLHDFCEEKGISLIIWGIDEIANQIFTNYRSMITELGLSIDTNQILDVEDFVNIYDSNKMLAPLSTNFQFRERELNSLLSELQSNGIIVVTGKAGVGKTRLVLEAVQIFARRENYKLLCVKNNNLSLYQDLVSATETPGKYMFFVDDANELADLNQILQYTTQKQKGYEVKIILTVRDYVKMKVIEAVKQYRLPRVIELSPFSDEELKLFLNENLNIFNTDYIKQIIRIAEGNPRIAYMAGKLASKFQDFSMIQNAYDIYDQYYRKYVEESFGNDEELCITAGILSILNCVLLDDLSPLQDLLKAHGMTIELFKMKVRQLSSLEFVEIHLEQVATLSDQCLSNYMLYYVFFQKKLMCLSMVLEICYKNFRNSMINTLNTILNLYESDDTRDYCSNEIKKVWNKLKDERHPDFIDFVEDFHVFNPEESFILAKKKIDDINKQEFSIFEINVTENVYDENDSVLKLLRGYEHSEYIEYVIDLLLNYSSRGKKNLIVGLKWLKNAYGLSHNDYKFRYYTQVKICEQLLERMKGNDDVAEVIGFHWAIYSLDFNFQSSEMGRGDSFIIYQIVLNDSDDLANYRKRCWEILISLAKKNEWKKEILNFLNMYSINIYKQADNDIIIKDFHYIAQLFELLDSSQVRFYNMVSSIVFKIKKFGVESELVKKWDRESNGEEWELYRILNKNFLESGLEYEEYIKKKEEVIIEYGKQVEVSDVCNLIQIMNNILSEEFESTELFKLNSAFEKMVQQFNELVLKEFLKCFTIYGSNISINPNIVLRKLNKKNDSRELLETLKFKDFPQKNEWMYSFFDTLSPSKIDKGMLGEFIKFIKDGSDKELSSSFYRNLRILDKFIELEPNIYPITSLIIYEKQNDFISDIYFSHLFQKGNYSPSELLFLYKSDINLLQKIYFSTIKRNHSSDYEGIFLLEFLKLDNTWIEKYSELFWECEKNWKDCVKNKNKILWKSNSYIDYFDYIFYNFPIEKELVLILIKAYKNELTSDEPEIVENQMKWLKHIIRVNHLNDKIVTIFDIICELNNHIKLIAVQTLLEINKDFKVFEKIRLIPRSWSGEGSFIPAYSMQIKFLESLYPIVSGIEFLEHKSRIKIEIDNLKRKISEEERRIIYNKYNM